MAPLSSIFAGGTSTGTHGCRNYTIIGDKPTLILLDELPPYLLNASTRAVGKGSLADVVI